MLQKDDFVTKMAEKGYTKREAAIILDDFVRTVEEILASGESVMFRGFGTFSVKDHAERDSVDPQTKEKIRLPSYRAPKFTPGKLLKRAVKEGMVRE